MTSTSASYGSGWAPFMKDLNVELWKLGIPATTQHNEVAPAQHEMAPIYSMCNLAVDQNQLAMETHEAGGDAATVWSACSMRSPTPASTARVSTTTGPSAQIPGENLLDPGRHPQ